MKETSVSLRPVLVIIVAYLLGSIPFGYLIVRAKEGGDVRQTGSGGTGATNVSRRAGKAAGVLTLLLDALKGAAAVLIAMWVLSAGANRGAPAQASAAWCVAAAALAVMIGHIFPVWLKFRGGKGVATGVGVFLVLMPAVVGIAALVFVAIVLLTRYVSLGSIVAALSIPLLTLLQHKFVSPDSSFAPLMTVAVVGALLIVFAHRENVERLVMGRENKFR
ncbi:MAG: glycerol-3-phosphate 1-O-acyltransferase PlsY [Pyrinomonadaceae bacterium]|nr:glycerol-3-phosphate 1-O-acyltransferase PlsY [Pyrinomonadaceae bacterium]